MAAQNGLIFAATESPIGAESSVLPDNNIPPAASFMQADTQTSGDWPGAMERKVTQSSAAIRVCPAMQALSIPMPSSGSVPPRARPTAVRRK